MHYNNFGNGNNDGQPRLPKPTYSGTLSDDYDESKVKRQKTEPTLNVGFSSNLYSNTPYYENSWNTDYNSQLHTFTPHNQYYHPLPQSTQYEFQNSSSYTQNGIHPTNHDTRYPHHPEIPKQPSLYFEAAPPQNRNTNYRTSISYEDVTIPVAKKTKLVKQEKNMNATGTSEKNLKPTSRVPASLKFEENIIKKKNFPSSNVQDSLDSELDEDEDEQRQEGEGAGKVVLVPGTSIALVTDDDIKKWREERKKMWLLKISNNKTKHMQSMGIKEDELKGQPSILRESRKEKQFIQSIQNQVQRGNPKTDLNIKLIQREFANENSQILDFIKELGDANLLEYELTQEEKDVLFGTPEDNTRNNYKPNYRNRNANSNRGNFSRNR
ncbi:Rsa1p [Saccharomyces eubayanus]|uniref:Rsa1p n=1 Tax=Saccharomyces eubayanus TaxID=1080349 RepID=UPI0006C17E9F|nr:RSA1-like protein [Saccharomyces eubayanus]KOG96126.1 RSA1-like protein [Saccharomyces eubayanus]